MSLDLHNAKEMHLNFEISQETSVRGTDRMSGESPDTRGKTIIDLVLSESGGKMSIGQVADLFRVESKVVMQAIRKHARSSDGNCRISWRSETVRI